MQIKQKGRSFEALMPMKGYNHEENQAYKQEN